MPLALPDDVAAVLSKFRVCEFSTLAKDGTPITHPVCAYLRDDGTFLLTTSIGLPQKAFNVRRDGHVSLFFSEPTGSGLQAPAAVLVQGDAVAPEEVVTDLSRDEDYWMNAIFRRQPDSAFMHAWPMKRWTWWYFMRIHITITPRRIRYWPGGDMRAPAIDLQLEAQ